MILLFGGTSETAPVATALAEAGHRVLVSTATENDLDVGGHPNITRRTGRLNASEMAKLIKEKSIKAVVDASHPFAEELHKMVDAVTAKMKIPCVTFARPRSEYSYEHLTFVTNHEESARIAFSRGSAAVLLTSGSRNIAPYVKQSRKSGIPLIARVLPGAESTQACRSAGLSNNEIITGRGPFSVEENRAVIRRFKAGTLVTKDSGVAGGVPEKVEAARMEKCRVVIVERPKRSSNNFYENAKSLVSAITSALQKNKNG